MTARYNVSPVSSDKLPNNRDQDVDMAEAHNVRGKYKRNRNRNNNCPSLTGCQPTDCWCVSPTIEAVMEALLTQSSDNSSTDDSIPKSQQPLRIQLNADTADVPSFIQEHNRKKVKLKEYVNLQIFFRALSTLTGTHIKNQLQAMRQDPVSTHMGREMPNPGESMPINSYNSETINSEVNLL